MFFECDENGKIMICADTPIEPGMMEITPPEGFIPEEMEKWTLLGGEIVANPDYRTPEKPATQGERIAAVEDALADYEAAYMEGVNEA